MLLASKQRFLFAAIALAIACFSLGTPTLAQGPTEIPLDELVAPPPSEAPAAAQTPASVQEAADKGKDATEDPDCSLFGNISGCIYSGINIFLGFVGNVVGLIITLMAALMTTIINASRELNSNAFIENGFGITLATANLGFVLAIILIAYTTILRLEGYETKKLLRNLIIAAVLVNFSRLIAGFVIDFSNVLAYGFLNALASANYEEIGTALADSLKIQSFAEVGGGFLNEAAETGGALLSAIISVLMGIIFSVLTLIIFVGIAVMLLIRYIYITVLLILMPLAWLLWTIPQLAKYWHQWWEKFLQWNFFLPAVSFFLYLAVASSTKMDEMMGAAGAGSAAGEAFSASILQKGGATTFLNAILTIGFFAAALVAGNALKIAGAGAALGAAKGFTKELTGYKKVKFDELGKKAGTAVSKQGLARIPLVRTALKPFLKPVREGAKELERKHIEKGGGVKIGGRRFLGKEGVSEIAENIESGKIPVGEAQQRATGKWYGSLSMAGRREKARYALALAKLHKEGKRVGPLEDEWKDTGAKDDDGRMIIMKTGKQQPSAYKAPPEILKRAEKLKKAWGKMDKKKAEEKAKKELEEILERLEGKHGEHEEGHSGGAAHPKPAASGGGEAHPPAH